MGVHLLTWKITDSAGDSKSCVMPIPDTATYAEVCAFVLEIDSLLDAVIEGVITSASVQMSCPIDGALNATPADDKLVSDCGLVGFSVSGSDYRTSLVIPTIADSLVANDKSIANSGAMATLVTALLGGANADVCDKYENVLSAFLSGKRVHRK